MRYFTFLTLSCFLFFSLSARAQDGRKSVPVQLKWQGYYEVPGLDQKLHKMPAAFSITYRGGSRLPFYSLNVPGNVAEGQLRDAVYEPFSAADAALFKGLTLPAPTPETFARTERGQPVTVVLLPVVRRNGQSGQPEKLVSATYIYLPGPTTASRGQQITYASQSVLSTGTWFKIGVAESGIFKLTRSYLSSLGLDVQNTNPNRIQVFGNATGMLPQPNSTPRPDDLVENAVYFAGNSDATFDNSEYFLFYARGPHVWEQVPATQRFRHVQHLYTDTAYYFVRVAPTGTGRRAAAAPAVAAPNSPDISTFTERWAHEIDLVNLAKSGRQWLGEGFNAGTSKSFTDSKLADLVAGQPIQVTLSVAGTGASFQSFALNFSGTTFSTAQAIDGVGGGDYPDYAKTSLQTHTTTATGPTLSVGLTYNDNGSSGTGYLDYLEVNAVKQLRLAGAMLEFRSFDNLGAGKASRFNLSGGSGATVVWDVTNPRRARAYAVGASGSFVAPTDSVREFVAFNPTGTFPEPRSFGRVANQNLHAMNAAQNLDLVIVTYPPFKAEAERLAAYRRSHDGLNVRVVTTTEVYNEFGSGGQDITAIRDMMRMVYNQRDNPNRHQFLLLFGDASYDYKGDPTNATSFEPSWWANRLPANSNQIAQNYVPTYESRDSFTQIGLKQTYCSDDYFGLLDEGEGEWNEDVSVGELMDVGVGRLPIRTPRNSPRSTAQATAVVDKLLGYESWAAHKKWRNRITFVADDGDGSSHVSGYAEVLAANIARFFPEYNQHKVYLDFYQQNNTASGEQSPDCEQALDDSFEQGSLIVSYNGHGGPRGLTQENILTNNSVLRLQNQNNLTFMVTGTCDFSLYDNPEFDSAGEQALTDTKGGAIGLYTTTRLVYASTELLAPLYDSLLSTRSGRVTRLGEAIRYSKNEGARNVLNRNYVLLGDPSMHLARPELAMTLDAINGNPVTNSSDTLKALSTVTLAGSVHTTSVTTSPINTGFSGTAHVTVYEKPTTVYTRAGSPYDVRLPIQVQENVIYDGQATVTNGQFSVQFVVPRDINYNLGLGKVSLYAATANTSNPVVDAHGYRAVPVGSAALLANTDTIPPRIRMFMNDDRSFVSGGLTGTTTVLLARLFDESGINTSGAGIGHEITATLDDDPTKLTVLNDFYTASVDSFQSGLVRYTFKDLATGPHILHMKAWDTFNNAGTRDIEFIAAQTESLALSHVLNYPNPFAKHTTFHFDHNRSGDDLDVQVQIFTVSGRLVRTLRTNIPGSGSHVPANYNDSSLSWNGRDEYDDQLARGVYVYRVSVRSARDQSTTSKFEKLVILN